MILQYALKKLSYDQISLYRNSIIIIFNFSPDVDKPTIDQGAILVKFIFQISFKKLLFYLMQDIEFHIIGDKGGKFSIKLSYLLNMMRATPSCFKFLAR